MMCAKYSAILYSYFNIELAYKLKKACRDNDTNLINVDKFTDLVYLVSENNYNTVFIDCKTIPKSAQLFEFLQGFKHLCNTLLVFIDCEGMPICDRFYSISSKTLFEDLATIKVKFELLACDRYKSLDMYDVQDKISSYLMSIGFLPKHMGFTYIKQVIMYGLVEGGLFCSLSKELYPYIAIKNHTNAVNVERNIRNAISLASSTDKYQRLKLSLGDKPSNRLLLNFLVDKAVQVFKDVKYE